MLTKIKIMCMNYINKTRLIHKNTTLFLYLRDLDDDFWLVSYHSHSNKRYWTLSITHAVQSYGICIFIDEKIDNLNDSGFLCFDIFFVLFSGCIQYSVNIFMPWFFLAILSFLLLEIPVCNVYCFAVLHFFP